MKRKRNSKIISLLLAVMMILSSLTVAGISALAATSGGFEYEILSDGTAEITGYTGSAETLEIPSTLNGYTVTSIGDYAFGNCDSLTSITIPNSVTSIGDNTFYACDNLSNVDIGKGVESIGDEAFGWCESLTSVTIPKSVTSIGDNAFAYCSSLTSITVDENNKAYSSQDGALFNEEKTELIQYPAGNDRTSYSIPGSVTSIGNLAFAYCDSLTSITIPDSVTRIGSCAFNGTGYYNDDTNWENGVLYIGNHLIGANPDEIPSEYIINEGTVTIADDAFADNRSLTSVTIPDSVTSIGDYAFAYCDSLTSIIVDENNKNYSSQDGVLFDKEKTKLIQYPIGNERKSYDIPNSVKVIGESSFAFSANLTEVYLGNEVQTISDFAFDSCYNLDYIELDYKLESIGNYAFLHCSISDIVMPESVTSIGEYAFGLDVYKTIYGYENSYAQTYAEENGYGFVPFYTYESSESGITVDTDKSELPEDTELVVSVKEETEDSVTYDISLQSGGAEVQPTGSVTVKIPVPETMDGESVKVYRVEADGTMTDMNAVYKDGCMVFTTEHFSEYVLKTDSSEVKAEPGDVNGDGKINALDVLIVKRYIAKYDDAKLEGDMFARADVSGDGKVNAKDALAIMQKIAKLINSFDEIK